MYMFNNGVDSAGLLDRMKLCATSCVIYRSMVSGLAIATRHNGVASRQIFFCCLYPVFLLSFRANFNKFIGQTGIVMTEHGERKKSMGIFQELWVFRDIVIAVLTPVVLLPLPLSYPLPEAKCAYGVLIITVYWITGALPMGITALLPMVLFPVMRVQKAKVLGKFYFQDETMLAIGGFVAALAMEKWNLHKRIALRVLLSVSSNPVWLMFWSLLMTSVFSMWMSNTAIVTLMIPIAKAVAEEFRRLEQHDTEEKVGLMKSEDNVDDIAAADTKESEQGHRLKGPHKTTAVRTALMLSISYGAIIGGLATPIGNSSHEVLRRHTTQLGAESDITFKAWFVFAFPVAIICFLASWIWLQLSCLGIREIPWLIWRKKEIFKVDKDASRTIIKREYDALSPITFAEYLVGSHVVVLVILWLSRDSEFFSGWSVLFNTGLIHISDTVPAVIVAFLLFVVPSSPPNFLCCKRKNDLSAPGPKSPLIDWKFAKENIPWEVVFVTGAGMALTNVAQVSGLTVLAEASIMTLKNLPTWLASLVVAIIISLATEIISNKATVGLFMPAMVNLGLAMKVNPLVFMLVTTVASSFAFILPVSTPPNTIVFSYGQLKRRDMAKAGVVINIICIVVLTLAVNTWGSNTFKLDEFPTWAQVALDRANNMSNVALITTPLPIYCNVSTSI